MSDVERLSYRLPDAAAALGVSLRTLYRAVAQDRIKSVKLGGSRAIPAAEVERIAAKGFPPLDPEVRKTPHRPKAR